jgi:hypothetical protein
VERVIDTYLDMHTHMVRNVVCHGKTSTIIGRIDGIETCDIEQEEIEEDDILRRRIVFHAVGSHSRRTRVATRLVVCDHDRVSDLRMGQLDVGRIRERYVSRVDTSLQRLREISRLHGDGLRRGDGRITHRIPVSRSSFVSWIELDHMFAIVDHTVF